jgi:hypothetical protein
MRLPLALLRPARRAHGQVAVEFALSIMLVLTLLLGFFDLARGLVAQAAVSEVAWAGARFAASGACLSSPREEQPAPSSGEVSGAGGPTCPGGSPGGGNLSMSTGSSAHISSAQQDAIATQARAAAFAIDAGSATISVQFPDSGTRLGQRVRVQVTYSYVPVASQFIGGHGVIQLSSSQTLLIAR